MNNKEVEIVNKTVYVKGILVDGCSEYFLYLIIIQKGPNILGNNDRCTPDALL